MLKKNLLPLVIRTPGIRRTKRIIFLDRDGVINRFPGMGAYVTRPKDFHFIPGAVHAIRLLTQAGFEVNVISNQGCVSRGMITLSGLHRLTKKMIRRIKSAGGELNGVYYCVHQMSDQCRCKKPNTVLLKKALRRRHFDLSDVFFIGDSKEDMQAAKKMKCRALLVLSGRTKKNDLNLFKPKPDQVKKDLLEAARWVIQKRS